MDVKHLVRSTAHRTRAGIVLGAAGDLIHLADLYGYTNKRQHGYLSYYERHLGPRRLGAHVVHEIGVGRGGSLRMWSRGGIRERRR
jgi:hypothetical protein